MSYTTAVNDNVVTFNVNLTQQDPYLFVLSSFISVGEQNGKDLPASFSLFQNYPNPFNPETTFSYQLPVSSKVILNVYDVLGQEVRILLNKNISAGSHSVVWDGKNELGESVSSGIYFYQLKIDNPNYSGQTKKLLIIK